MIRIHVMAHLFPGLNKSVQPKSITDTEMIERTLSGPVNISVWINNNPYNKRLEHYRWQILH